MPQPQPMLAPVIALVAWGWWQFYQLCPHCASATRLAPVPSLRAAIPTGVASALREIQ